MRRFWAQAISAHRVAFGLAATLGLAMCAVPLLGVHGVESALCLGLFLPPAACAVAARSAWSARAETIDALSLIGRGLALGLGLLALPVVLLGLNAVRVRNCDPLQGLAFIALGPGAGVALASLWGVAIGCLPLRRSRVTALALSLPLAAMLSCALGLYVTPGIFAYGHFFGYFPGTLYDELITLPYPLLTLRLLSLCWACAAVAIVVGHRDADGVLSARPRPGTRTLRSIGGLGLVVGALGAVFAPELGQATSAAHIMDTLGGRHRSARCDIVFPRELSRQRLSRFAFDCDVRVAQLEHWFGLRQPKPIRVYLFRNAAEKQRLMGAGGTNIAKPWRNEIYLQDVGFPHPVLPHELAHIVAAHVGRGPFRISGVLGGLWPNPALIEGVAVAASWAQSSRSGMTPHQWTRAMLELDLAAPLSDLVGASFLGQQKRMAYTLSGSFVRFVADTQGSAAVRALYRSGDPAAALGVPIGELEARWHAFVRTVPLPDGARALAEQRFSGGSIFSDVCPHKKAELKVELGGQLSGGDDEAAVDTCRRILDVDQAESGTRAVLVGILARLGQEPAAERELGALVGPPAAPAPVIAAARQAVADERWRSDKPVEALTMYRALLGEPNDRDALRQLQAKTVALSGSARQAELMFELLIGHPGSPIDGGTAVHLIRELRAERSDGFAQYLEARQLWFRERYAEAARLLADARELGLPSRDLEIEALRVEAICRYGAGEPDAARALFRALSSAPDVDLAVDAEADDWLQWLRIAARQAH